MVDTRVKDQSGQIYGQKGSENLTQVFPSFMGQPKHGLESTGILQESQLQIVNSENSRSEVPSLSRAEAREKSMEEESVVQIESVSGNIRVNTEATFRILDPAVISQAQVESALRDFIQDIPGLYFDRFFTGASVSIPVRETNFQLSVGSSAESINFIIYKDDKVFSPEIVIGNLKPSSQQNAINILENTPRAELRLREIDTTLLPQSIARRIGVAEKLIQSQRLVPASVEINRILNDAEEWDFIKNKAVKSETTKVLRSVLDELPKPAKEQPLMKRAKAKIPNQMPTVLSPITLPDEIAAEIQAVTQNLKKLKIPKPTQVRMESILSSRLGGITVVDTGYALEEGGLAMIAKKGTPSIVLLRSKAREADREAAFIDQFNESLPSQFKVKYARNVAELVQTVNKIRQDLIDRGGVRPEALEKSAYLLESIHDNPTKLKKELQRVGIQPISLTRGQILNQARAAGEGMVSATNRIAEAFRASRFTTTAA